MKKHTTKRRKLMKGGLVNADRQTLLSLGFNQEQINYLIQNHSNMDISFFQRSIATPDQIMSELRDIDSEIDNTDSEGSDNSTQGGRRRLNKRRTCKRRRSRRRTCKRRRRLNKRKTYYGGINTVSEGVNLLEEDEYDQLKNALNYKV